MSFLIMGNWRWGHAEDLAQAKKNFRAQGAKLSDGYAIIEYPEGSEFKGVDQMGRYHWEGIEPTVTYVDPKSKR